MVTFWIVEVEFFPNTPIELSYTYTDAALKAVAVILLIYSLRKIQSQVKSVQNPNFFANERLMQIHLYIFIIYLISYVIFDLNATLEAFMNPYEKDEEGNLIDFDYENYCRYMIADKVLFALCQASNIALMTLFIYLSVKFSTPVNDDYRSKFMLLFNKEDLHKVHEVQVDYDKA